ncbi:MAG: AAA family ATPase, partial [Clostridiaceae bacterium]|nr:AAA family ATPase [Clostridiaceae bacterium]
MQKRIIFISGIHGVGKSTFCRNLIKKNKKIKYESCSNLLLMHKNLNYKENKNVDDVNKNQQILFEAIKIFFNDSDLYLLDGHFCLINNQDEIVNIPSYLFEKLDLISIILLKNTPENIFLNLKKRDNKEYDINFVKTFQHNEILRAKYISKKLNVELIEIDLNLIN